MTETRPSPAAVEAWVQLLRAQRLALQAVEAELKRAGLPPLAWYDVLLELRRAGEEGLRPLALEAHLLLAQHNVSRLLDRLEAAGLVERRRCATDGRGQQVAITATGRDLQERMWTVYGAAIRRHVGDVLGEADARRLGELLAKLARASEPTDGATKPAASRASPPGGGRSG